MPELPEVETIVRELRHQGLIGRTIEAVRVYWQRTIAIPNAVCFQRRLRGQTVTGLWRRGKYIVIQLASKEALLIHLRMTGRLYFASAEDSTVDAYVRVALYFENGQVLRFRDTRKFGRWYLLQDAQERLKYLGPEPLDQNFDVNHLAWQMKQRKRTLKALLLDQKLIAGLGNIYVDEALWESRLHPATPCSKLKADEVRNLHHAIVTVLQRGIANLGTSLGQGEVNYYSVSGRRGRNQDALNVFRRTGHACPRCKHAIRRLIIAQRSSHFCPHCQRRRFFRVALK